jgi:hypothetical protein
MAGTPITFTATAQNGVSPYQYKWWVYNGSTWTVGQAWGTSKTFAWTPSAVGSYQVQVWARSAGNPADAAEAYQQVAYTVTSTGLTVTGLTAAPAAPQVAGTPITLTATTTGGGAPLQFKWWVEKGGVWSVAQDWRTGNTFAWAPGTAGSYTLQVWARSNGNTANTAEAYRQISYTVTALPVTLTANPVSPQKVGTAITFTASAGPVPYEYKWWLYNGSSWSALTGWQTGRTYPWSPGNAGNYQVQVWVRPAGSSADAAGGSASQPFMIVPNLVGTYAIAGSATNSGCTDPSDNGAVSLSGTLTISSQAGGSFSGTLNVIACGNEGCEPDMLTLSGTITATGRVSGSLGDAEGSYAFSGTLSGNNLAINFAGAWRDDIGSCNVGGSFTATKQ